jgi:hypothetical protein
MVHFFEYLLNLASLVFLVLLGFVLRFYYWADNQFE